jgi:hypothetical protein
MVAPVLMLDGSSFITPADGVGSISLSNQQFTQSFSGLFNVVFRELRCRPSDEEFLWAVRCPTGN